ncbi:MAG: valine--tRNA ligase [Ferrovum sp.]|nr:valine--tRNA ligase [Ferrovum sp.]
MTLAKSYDPQAIESRWYTVWEERGDFKPSLDPTAPAYCILLPPPNVTGTLHMGHAFQHTLMDCLIRYQRMRGANVLWQAGTDHAGIATQILVERQLESQGEDRRTLGRPGFLEKVWEWKEQSGSTITRQMRRMGSSCDWTRERFTLDDNLSRAVTKVFVRLYREGLIYRGQRLVNWDPVLQTAVSDLEVESHEEQGHLWHIRYPLVNGSGALVVATTRPETLLGDVAVAVHPEDERYRSLIGQQLHLPLTLRTIPIIADDSVDPAFGTGCVKITPAHDFNDYQTGQRHGLVPLNILTPDAHLNDQVPEAYRGLERFVARKQILADLKDQELLVEVKPHTLMIPRGDRSHAVIEPMLSDQWFLNTEAMGEEALRVVHQGEVRFVPANWVHTYEHWLENLQHWCISRQLWWGHQIPAWYDEDGMVYVAETQAEAEQQAGGKTLRRDADVLDTWFSSALWPFSTLGWPDETIELKQFLPSQVLVTGFDIIFFWVARMIMMTTHFTGQVPFREVFVTGLVRDAQGHKMSKSRGNVLDPLDLIDGIDLERLVQKRTSHLMDPRQAEQIEKSTRTEFPQGIPAFGTDALRFTFASLATHGRDIKFDMQRCDGYRNFCNKLWNATRFVLMQEVSGAAAHPPTVADQWIRQQFDSTLHTVTEALHSYRFDLAARAIYEFVWEQFCDWYVELAKPQLANPLQATTTRQTLLEVLEATLRLAHPFIPFITEELWQQVAPQVGKLGPSIALQPYPHTQFEADPGVDAIVSRLKALVVGCRTLRSEMGISPAERLPLKVAGETAQMVGLVEYVRHLARLSDVEWSTEPLSSLVAPVVQVEGVQLQLQVTVDAAAETERLSKQRGKLQEEVDRCRAKLDNAGFVARAPAAVVAQEQERLSRFSQSLAEVSAQLARLQ